MKLSEFCIGLAFTLPAMFVALGLLYRLLGVPLGASAVAGLAIWMIGGYAVIREMKN